MGKSTCHASMRTWVQVFLNQCKKLDMAGTLCNPSVAVDRDRKDAWSLLTSSLSPGSMRSPVSSEEGGKTYHRAPDGLLCPHTCMRLYVSPHVSSQSIGTCLHRQHNCFSSFSSSLPSPSVFLINSSIVYTIIWAGVNFLDCVLHLAC